MFFRTNSNNIINNTNTTNDNNIKNDKPLPVNLEQGREILQYNTDMDNIVSPHLKMIEQGSILEGMENRYNTLSSRDKEALKGLDDMEKRFQNTLSEYTKTYQLFSEDILHKNQSKKKIVDYLGKVISTEDGNNYYVNNYGYTHMYSGNAWEKNDKSCPSVAVSYTGHLNKFNRGIPMNMGQPCSIAGKNIVNSDTKEEAWVDIEGVKHPYSSNIKSSTCSKKSTINLSKQQYDNIPTGNTMRETDQCVTLDVNPMLWAKLESLNTQMKSIGMMIAAELENLHLEDNDANNMLVEKQQQLIKYIAEISDDKQQLTRYDDVLLQLSGEEQDATIRMKSNYYIYWFWTILMIFIVWFTIKITTSTDTGTILEEQSVMFYTIIAILAVYIRLYLFRKIYMSV